MNKLMYWKAKRYALKLRPIDSLDLVHDAYLKWFDKTGKDLFNEKEGTVLKVIKNIRDSQDQHKKFMYRGKIYSRKYYSMDEAHHPAQDGAAAEHWVEKKFEINNNLTPEQELIRQESQEKINKHVFTFLPHFRDCFSYKMAGYSGVEISGILSISPQLVSYYIQRMKLKELLN